MLDRRDQVTLPGTGTRYVASRDVEYGGLDGDSILLNMRTNRIYRLNRTATHLWELIQEGRTRNEIEHALLGRFEVDPEQLRTEMDVIIADLQRERLLTQVEADS